MALSQSERNRRYRQKPEKKALALAATSEWVKANRERRNAYMRKWWAAAKEKHPEKYFEMARRSRLKRLYGISLEDYDRLLTKQSGRCALCDKTPDKERNGYLSVDHCHETGSVRGLLCEQHNLALGKMGDTEAAIVKLLAYIRGI